MQSSRFQILSLDGGGLKGIFTAAFLANWEKDTGTRITDHFDLVTGTSAGGIIALGLGMGLGAAEILEFYMNKAEVIFPKRLLGNLKHWFLVKHSPEGLETALKEVFGDRTLGESRRPLIIPSYYAKRGEIYLFKTPHHKRLRSDWREKVTDVARATAAAPTYLSPHVKGSGLELVDGGVWANNPVMVGISEGLGYFEQPQHTIAALRIGTTYEVPCIDVFPSDGGKLSMGAAAVDYMMRGQERSASAMAGHILGNERYYEVNPLAAPGDFALDKLSKELIAIADHEYRFHSSNLADRGLFQHQAAPYTPSYP
jgi:patatin-like phospholipase/acyl hydrolase